MEKASIIFSVLIHSDEFMYLFWGILGVLNLSSGSFLLKSKGVTEKQLKEISPAHEHIMYDYTVYSVYTFALTFVLTWIAMSSFNDWALENYGRNFYPSLIFGFAIYGVVTALFAMSKGVYPIVRPRMLFFIYDDVKLINRAAKFHIIISIVLFSMSVLVFFATV